MCCKKHILREHFIVYAALYSESKEGWIWISPKEYDGNFITIRNPLNNKSITCMLRTIDDNFIKYYKENSINKMEIDKNPSMVVSEYYRKILEIETKTKSNKTSDLEIYRPSIYEKTIKVYSQNPNPFIRIGIILGIVSVMLGLMPLLPTIFKFLVCLTTRIYDCMLANVYL